MNGAVSELSYRGFRALNGAEAEPTGRERDWISRVPWPISGGRRRLGCVLTWGLTWSNHWLEMVGAPKFRG